MIDTVVIPAAGLGSRFYPITEFIPKELLPVVSKPSIHYVVKEAYDSGIKNIIIVISERKELIKKYFTFEKNYLNSLYKYCSDEIINEVHEFKTKLDFYFVYQEKPLGLGDAILRCEGMIKNNPFAIILPDDLLVTNRETELSKMIKSFSKETGNYFTVKMLTKSEIPYHGIVASSDNINKSNDKIKITRIVEKPKIHDAPSDFGIIGRYIVTGDLFEAIKNSKPGILGEIQLTDSLNSMIENNLLTYGCKISSIRYDCGTPKGLAEATYNLSKSL